MYYDHITHECEFCEFHRVEPCAPDEVASACSKYSMWCCAITTCSLKQQP